jgi:hypothetical protein
MGHNSGDLTEDEEKALFFHHLRKREECDARVKEAQADKKSAGKLAQADGLAIADLDYASRALNAEDKKTITDRFGSFGRILNWLGLLPGYQSDLFTDRQPAIERITGEGELAGLAARERTSGYGPGSDEDRAWLTGYDRGQEIVRENFQAAMEKRNAAAARDQLIKGSDEDAEGDPFEDDEEDEAA